MAEIVKMYKESLPALTLVGKRYTDQDRNQHGLYTDKWGEWFSNGWFGVLEQNLELIGVEGEAYLGAMRIAEGGGEYWIGMFAKAGSPVPAGFESVEIPAGEIAVAWVRDKEEGGALYAYFDQCWEAFEKQGWKGDKDSWFLERYCCPRFTDPDGEGNVILDYCTYLVAE